MIRGRRWVRRPAPDPSCGSPGGRLLGTLVLTTSLLLVPASSSAQCFMCRTAFDSPEGREITGAYRRGILFMLATSALAAGAVGFVALRNYRRLHGKPGQAGRRAGRASPPGIVIPSADG